MSKQDYGEINDDCLIKQDDGRVMKTPLQFLIRRNNVGVSEWALRSRWVEG